MRMAFFPPRFVFVLLTHVRTYASVPVQKGTSGRSFPVLQSLRRCPTIRSRRGRQGETFSPTTVQLELISVLLPFAVLFFLSVAFPSLQSAKGWGRNVVWGYVSSLLGLLTGFPPFMTTGSQVVLLEGGPPASLGTASPTSCNDGSRYIATRRIERRKNCVTEHCLKNLHSN